MKIYRVVLFVCIGVIVSCSNNNKYSAVSQSESFTQNLNPPYLDILWVLDNRSEMYNARTNIIAQTQIFFERLDQSTSEYRMGLITTDMEFAKGQLQPLSAPMLLTKNVGTLSERLANFVSLISLPINVYTGGLDQGFLAAQTALQNYFIPRPEVPLVLVFISDSDDRSIPITQTGDVSQFSSSFINIKNSNPNLVKIFAINYTSTLDHCATDYNADITQSWFRNRYFRMADFFQGQTADLCSSSFGSDIPLQGLTLGKLATSFTLSGTPNPSTISVSVYSNSNTPLTNLPWTYNSANDSIDFTTAPPSGSTIVVNYLPQ